MNWQRKRDFMKFNLTKILVSDFKWEREYVFGICNEFLKTPIAFYIESIPCCSCIESPKLSVFGRFDLHFDESTFNVEGDLCEVLKWISVIVQASDAVAKSDF